MQTSAQKLNQTIEKQLFAILYQVLTDCRGEKELQVILQDFLTGTEQLVLAKRLAIAIYLDKGRSYENIKESLKVSSATIASVQATIGNPGWQLALQKVKAEEWADGWSKKLSMVWEALKG